MFFEKTEKHHHSITKHIWFPKRRSPNYEHITEIGLSPTKFEIQSGAIVPNNHHIHVIQYVTFLSPNVGGHLTFEQVTQPSQKVTKNC